LLLREMNLDALLDALRAFHAALQPGEDCENALSAAGIDHLPHYGGPRAPLKMFELWSWDDDRVLVGTGPFTQLTHRGPCRMGDGLCGYGPPRRSLL
jgi:hypothetical protein